MKASAISVLFILMILSSCSSDEDPRKEYTLGQNYFTTLVDGETREYYVHVPQSYDEDASVPMVLMLHGGSGTGLITYNSSGWKEVGEEENIIWLRLRLGIALYMEYV